MYNLDKINVQNPLDRAMRKTASWPVGQLAVQVISRANRAKNMYNLDRAGPRDKQFSRY